VRYRRYRVRQSKDGSVDVVSYGIFARGLYWWLFAIFFIGFVMAVVKYWYIWLPILGLLTWAAVVARRSEDRKKLDK
jgi:hypothetical protein